MWNNFKAMQKKYGRKYFAFMPETYNYPAEARQLKLKIKKYNNTALWICKPPRGQSCNVDSSKILVEGMDTGSMIL